MRSKFMTFRPIVALFLLLLAGCASGPRIHTSVAPGIDLTRYERFAFVEPLGTDRAGYASIISRQLSISTQRELELHGLEFVENLEEADLLVNFFVHLNEKIRTRQVADPWMGPTFYDYRYGLYSPWPRYSTSTEIQQFSEGTLIIDLFDAETNQMVWEGTARNEVNERDRREAATRLDNLVKLIFAEFSSPPAATY